MRLAIVTCATANWIPWAAVTLLSCVENGKTQDADLLICVHGASAKDRLDLQQFNASHDLKIRLIDVDATTIDKSKLRKWGVGAVMRLKLDHYLDSSFDRVLYLDSDILVLAPLHRLLQTELGDCIAAAVPDIGFMAFARPKKSRRIKALGFERQGEYFNSGVILFNWPETLHQGILGQTLAVLEARGDLRSPDQDALNLVMKHRWKAVDYRWNVASIERKYLKLDPFIVHFTGRKPWTASRGSRDTAYFHYYDAVLRNSPWPDFVSRQRTFTAVIQDWMDFLLPWIRFRRRWQLRNYLGLN